jgi:hypothetical protein
MRVALLVVVATLLFGVSARAGPPSASLSQVDPCIVTCPAGDSVFAAYVLEGNGAPTEPDRETVLDLCGGPDVRFAPVAVGSGSAVEFSAKPTPNPGHGAMDFILRSPTGGRAVLAVHDVTGRRLATVLDTEIGPGVQRVAWSGRDGAGRLVASGLYFFRFTLGMRRSQGMLVLAR